MDLVQQIKTKGAKAQEKPSLPLVLQIIPGQAKTGVYCKFEAGTWEGENIASLVNAALKREYSIEDREVLAKIKEQVNDGGKLLYQGKDIDTNGLSAYLVKEKTDSGQEYFYSELKAIKAQEGGGYCGYY
ncbi:hypothetical protein HZC32_00310 [Candidatus Woesearchaeota archaeon]|nr:hypothetical protein [Candidatus Woesearchaeota archaeon]